jgi:acetylornithine deacetylase
MPSHTPDPVELTARLCAERSYSGEEDAAAAVVEEALRAAGIEPRRFERNVWAERGSGARTLLLNSHLDTVPAGPDWTRDPWQPEIEKGRLYGLGANDAKSCVAAMLCAFLAFDPGERGRLVLAATAEEEGPAPGAPPGSSRGLEHVLPLLGAVHGAVVGEPTGGAICPGQRGRAVLRLHAEGRAGHASRPHEGVNAIEIAAADVLALAALAREVAAADADPLLGAPTIQATLVEGGTKSNVIPARAAVTLDVRTTPRFDNDRAPREVQARCRSRVEVVQARFRPLVTPEDAPVLRAARAALPHAHVRAFGGVSDLYHCAYAPSGRIEGLLFGPGESAQSHQADEFVGVDAVRGAAQSYRRIAEAFFAR